MMGEITSISWCDHTFNHVIGCSKVHAGCLNCYAEADMDKRRGRVQWGPNGTRSRTSNTNWQEPLKWDRAAKAAGIRHRVFCASLADVFEDWQGPIIDHKGNRLYSDYMHNSPSADPIGMTMADLRQDLFRLIDATPNLDWLLLTKRPENICRMWGMKSDKRPIFPGMPGRLGEPVQCLVANAYRSNVWLGTSVSDQVTADKMIPELLQCRDLSPVLFLSAEPLLGPIDLVAALQPVLSAAIQRQQICPPPKPTSRDAVISAMQFMIDWVIAGGESGPNARGCNVWDLISLANQCAAGDIAFFMKQMGANSYFTTESANIGVTGIEKWELKDSKGGNPSEWPENLRVRQFPTVK